MIPELDTQSSTSTQRNTNKKINAISLDKVLDGFNYNENRLLIKIDIDGYDWDAILSAKEIIKTKKPLLFLNALFKYISIRWLFIIIRNNN